MMPEEVSVELDDAMFASSMDVGALSRQRGGSATVCRFVYSEAWLSQLRQAFSLDPELPLFPGEMFPAKPRGLFGIFRDTAPDRWGRVLMERREGLDAARDGRKPRQLGEWDFLLGVSDVSRIGALRLRELDDGGRYLGDHGLEVPPLARLRELEAAALALDSPGCEDRTEYETWLRQLLAPGSSLGGARPKATFSGSDGGLWIAKFPAAQDRHDVGAWEYLAHQLAERAKVRVPAAQCLQLGPGHRTFAVRRFDREGKRRRLYVSAMTLTMKDDGAPASYLDVALAIQDHGDPDTIQLDLAELYRRGVFNVLIGNRDDHLRNHGFLRGAKGWRLAPAFDVNPNFHKDEHALALDASTSIPSVAALRASREFYRLTQQQASAIEAEVRAALRGWSSLAATLGISRSEVQRSSAVIDPKR